MPNEEVHASASDVRKLAAALNTYATEVRQASKKVQGAMNHANWHDSRKQAFDARFKDHQKRLDGFLSGEVSEMVKALTQLASKLDDVRNTRM